MGSPLMNGIKMYTAISALGGKKTPPMETTNPVVDETPYSPVKSRMDAMSSDPKTTVMAGLNALNDPSVPQEMRSMYAEPLLRAKHYGRTA